MLATAVTSASAALASTKGDAQKPNERLNVILILSDDLGYGDVGYVGNPYIKTPNLDNLQAQSIRFDNFHTATTSSPTRSGLMTGNNCNVTGAWHTIQGRSIMDTEEYTLANAFKDNGYSTAMFGKWHLGDNYPYRPIDRGFDDVLYAKSSGPGQGPDRWDNNYFDDIYYRNHDIEEQQYGYCTDVWFSETQRFVIENKEKPFFCYLALNAAHAPHHIDESYVEPYRNNPNIPTPEIYGMMANIDENIGKLMSLLERLDLQKNTVVIYLGDNGSCGTSVQGKTGSLIKGYDGGLRGRKGMPFEGGHRQSMIMRIPGVQHAKVDALTAYVDIMPSLISLCDLTPAREIEVEGINFLASDYTGIDRAFVVDTQRKEYLKKYNTYCVAKNDWRLINGSQLYNLKTDLRQQRNLAKQYPEVVEELKAEYEKWWTKAIKRADDYQFIPIVDPNSDRVVINCQDLHDDTNAKNVWHQTMIRSATFKPAPTGYWTLSIPRSGRYNIDLYRWAPESGLAFNETAPEGRPVPNGEALPECVGVDNIVKAVIMVDGKEVAMVTNPDLSKQSITFAGVKLPQGDHKIKALLTDSDGETYSAWYALFSQR